jgi:hypothetical protein
LFKADEILLKAKFENKIEHVLLFKNMSLLAFLLRQSISEAKSGHHFHILLIMREATSFKNRQRHK